MRPILLASLLTLAGCTHVQPGQAVGLRVEPAPEACLSPLIGHNTRIVVANHSNQKIAFNTYGPSGPPYVLFADAFDVLAAQSPTQDFSSWQPILEHSMPPSHEVRLAPGDRAEFIVGLSRWPSPDSELMFKLQVRDTRWRPYQSKALRVCQPR